MSRLLDIGKGPIMSHDILKRLGLDHLDVSSPAFLEALNRMQAEARESLQRCRPCNDPEFAAPRDEEPITGFGLVPPE
jgi:hypothetical protein